MKHYETCKYSGSRHEIVHNITKISDGIISVDITKKYQTIVGFGGAFTEAAAYTLSKMSKPNQQLVLNKYFNQKEGLAYNLGRVPIHSSDFALGNYTYVEENDYSLKSFSIERDRQYVIPMIQSAEKIRGDSIQLLASPWSPPAWMKTNKNMNQGGHLLPEYKDVWAAYYVKFLDHYKKEGLTIDFLTVQNEPAAVQTWDSCIYSAEEERDFIKHHLGPALHHSKHKDIKLLVWDHNRDIIIERTTPIYEDKEASAYVWGTAFHWYVSEAFENLSEHHTRFPEKHLLFTEGCIEGGVRLGSFESGERYARNMIGDFSNYCEGYIDWNLTLNEQGGPNHVGNFCDAPIICDTITDTVHINSSYHAIGHFSKHIEQGAQRVESVCSHPELKQVAFENPDKSLVLIIQNETEKDIGVTLKGFSEDQPILIKKRSISTLTTRGEDHESL